MKIDLHTHSTASDGTDSPGDVIRRAVRLGMDVLALTDHDTFAGHAEAAAVAASAGLTFVPGMEMSTTLRGCSVHLLAYGADADDEALQAELVRVREGRSGRVPAVVAKLCELGVPITEADVAEQAGGDAVGRPHIADALVAAGHVADRAEAFSRFLHDGGPAHVERYATDLADGIGLIHAAGGVAIIAHPWGRSSRSVLAADTIGQLVRDHGLDGLEVDHADHGPVGSATRAELRQIAKTHGLIVTGSSDHHGLGKSGHEIGSELTDPAMFERLSARMG